MITSVKPPIAKRNNHQTSYHGKIQIDPYFWLREKENKEVIQYLEDENSFTEQSMLHTKPLQKKIYNEMVGRIKETDLSVPVKRDDFYYYSRTEEGKNYKIYCRKQGSLDAKEEIILDGNKLAEGKKYFSLRAFKISDDHKRLAYTVDYDGSEYYSLYVIETATGKQLEDPIEKTGGTVLWANDNKTLFYSTLDDTHRPYRLNRHEIGSSSDKDTVVFEELDGGFFLNAYKTKSKAYLIVHLGSKITSEVHFLDANTPEGTFQVFSPREKNIQYGVTHYGSDFYVTTNENALNFKVMKTSVNTVDKSKWETYIPHDKSVYITDVEAFSGHIVVHCRKGGFKNLQIIDSKTQEKHDIQFPDEVYTYWEESNPDFNTNLLRFLYSSLNTPRSVFNYNMDSREFILLKEYEVLGDFDKNSYETRLVKATAEDGTTIPISVVYKKGISLNGKNPCLLYGYGSYGHPSDPYFSSIRLSLLDRGFVFAIGHVRGGSEMGRQWYEDGKYLNKRNTFTDFIACAEQLIKEQFTSNDKLCINGGSAGGLLMGACMNLRPDLFHAVVAAVPFVDVINTMMDETIPLTVAEYEEWGNPNELKYFEYMSSYCPYTNVEAKAYPNVLITAGLNDPRVQYWEPAKWIAKLRHLKTNNNRLLMKTNMGAGHGGVSGRYEYMKEIAIEYAFFLDCVGITE